MKTYQYTSPENTVVHVFDEDGISRMSMLASAVPDGAEILPYTQTLAEQIAAFDAALVAHLDATARERRYDNRVTCALRAGYPGPFQAEGIAFASWMDQCNALAYQLLAEVVAGTRPMPDSPQALIDLMPAMVWPVTTT